MNTKSERPIMLTAVVNDAGAAAQTSSIQRLRLVKAIDERPAYDRFGLAKCAVGLAGVALVVAIGIHATISIALPTSNAAAGVAASTREQMRAQQHRQQVLEERRARFENGGQRSHRATERVELPKDLPMELL